MTTLRDAEILGILNMEKRQVIVRNEDGTWPILQPGKYSVLVNLNEPTDEETK